MPTGTGAEAPTGTGAETPTGTGAETPTDRRAEAPTDSRTGMPAGTRAEPDDRPAETSADSRTGMPAGTRAEPADVLLLDTSAAIALVVEDHEAHAATLAAVRGRRLGLAGHAWFETYSVLTRLPGGLRRSPADAVRLLTRDFPIPAFLGEAESAALRAELAALHVSGGAVYDALVAAAARQHGVVLVSADERARSVYEALGAAVEFVRRPEARGTATGSNEGG